MQILFRFFEKKLKTDIHYLARGGFWLLTGQGIQIFSGLIMSIVFANFLSKESFGTYQFIMSGAAILGVLTLSMTIPVKRASAMGKEGALRFGFRTQMKWSSGIFILGVFLSSYYFFNSNILLGKSFLLIGVILPFIGGFSLYKSYLLGKQKFKEVALLGLFLRPVLIITMLIAVYYTDDPFILVSVYFITNSISMGILYLTTVRRYKVPFISDTSILQYAKHMSVISIIGAVGTHAEKLLIFHFLGAAQVAIYIIALLPTTHLLKLYTIIGNLIFPKFAQRDYITIKRGMFRKTTLVFTLSVALVVSFIFSVPYIYNVVFPSYPEAISLSQLAILALLTKFGNLYMQAFSAHEMKKEQYIIKLSVVFLKIVLLLLFIPIFGILGAVYSLLLTHVYWATLSTILFYLKK